MTDKLKAAFLFVAPGADPETHQAWVKTDKVDILTIGVSSYEQAVETAKQLAADGMGAIELCGGFGHRGAGMIAEAVGDQLAVGVVRFDVHPGLGNVSGDTIF